MSIEVWRCCECGYRAFPERIWCPQCGRGEWRSEWVARGVIDAVTEVNRRGAPDSGAARVGWIALEGGGYAIARASAGNRGTKVLLEMSDGAITVHDET